MSAKLTAKQREALQELVNALELRATQWSAASTTVNRLKALGYVMARKEKVERNPEWNSGKEFSIVTVYEPTAAGRAALNGDK